MLERRKNDGKVIGFLNQVIRHIARVVAVIMVLVII